MLISAYAPYFYHVAEYEINLLSVHELCQDTYIGCVDFFVHAQVYFFCGFTVNILKVNSSCFAIRKANSALD